MITTIQKTFDFDAAHSLDFLPDGHKCKRIHGHTYNVEVEVQGEPDANGMLVDYADIANPVINALDHRNLNEIDGLRTSTTERVAAWILAAVQTRLFDVHASAHVTRVRVYESSTTWAEVRA